MTKGRKWVLVKPYDGLPKRTDVEVQEFDLPDPKDGEMLIAAEALSVDPYMRKCENVQANPENGGMAKKIAEIPCMRQVLVSAPQRCGICSLSRLGQLPWGFAIGMRRAGTNQVQIGLGDSNILESGTCGPISHNSEWSRNPCNEITTFTGPYSIVSLDRLFLAFQFWGSALKKGDTIMGQIIARVVKSKNQGFKAGDRVSAFTGWVSHAVVSSHTSTDSIEQLNSFPITKIPDSLKDYPPSLSLGVLGITGLTAYFGILKVGKLKPKDTVFVNAAAGAVGSLVGQIAKIKGCKVIGSTGSDEKVKYLTKELGFDAAINYKVVTHDKLSETLSKLAPDGIDVFFENVGGEASSVIYKHLNKNGRVAVCGSISNYNSPKDAMPKVTEFIQHLFYNSIEIKGFVVLEFMSEFEGALKEMAGWMQEGKLKNREHVHKGFDKMYDAFMDLFAGNNIGKVVVTV